MEKNIAAATLKAYHLSYKVILQHRLTGVLYSTSEIAYLQRLGSIHDYQIFKLTVSIVDLLQPYHFSPLVQ